MIAANFLGDKSPDVKKAMICNLLERVSYTYFVRSYADVLRLGMLREELEREIRDSPNGSADDAADIVGSCVNCVLLPTKLNTANGPLAQLLTSDYFLCPDNPSVGGFRLRDRATGGTRLDAEELGEIIDAVSPIVQQKVTSLYLSAEDRWAPSANDDGGDYCIACTDLASRAADFGHERWRKLVADYDRIVAREVSTFANEAGSSARANTGVVRPVRNGYLLVFKQAEAAAEWSKRLQLAIASYNRGNQGTDEPVLSHTISLDRGAASRVLRAHGYDYIGGAVDDCISQLAGSARDTDGGGSGVIVMSSRFTDEYKARVGQKEFAIRTVTTRGRNLLLWPEGRRA